MQKKTAIAIPDETVISKIFIVRGKKVMIDSDLADKTSVNLDTSNDKLVFEEEQLRQLPVT